MWKSLDPSAFHNMQRSRRAYESEPYFAHVAVEDEDEPAAEEGEEPVEPETEFVDVTAEGDYVHLGQSECEHQEQASLHPPKPHPLLR